MSVLLVGWLVVSLVAYLVN